jgi:hypothetical protein
MTMKNNKKTVSVLAALLTFAVTSAFATGQNAFDKVPAPEMAAKAAQMVTKAAASQKEQTAVAVVKAALAKNPALASVVIAAVCKVAPEVAPAVSAAAAEVAQEYAETIAAAAAKAAPQYATMIADSVSAAVPSAAASVRSRVRTERSYAMAASNGGVIVISPGVIAGIQFTPPVPPTPPGEAAVPGFDPRRYQSPTP